MSVECIASFRELTRGSPASPHQNKAVPNQTRKPSGKKCRDRHIYNTPFVDMSSVNRLTEHMFTILVFVRAERGEGWCLPLCVVENMILYYFAPGHFFKDVRPTNHQSRVSATFIKSTLPNIERCWDAHSNSWS